VNIASPAKRRARRIAADEAHSWARNLRLKNPYAKLVLCMITQYVQGDGTCFVGIKALADDCELAEETVRRRLAWLEAVGAIVRLPQWIDENGRRNSEVRGRRTTDEIRLLFEADLDEIEARAAGHIEAENEPSVPKVDPLRGTGSDAAEPAGDPLHGRGSTYTEKTFSPPRSPLATPSLRRGAESSEPEPEPERDPPTPQGGDGSDLSDHASEAKAWAHVESWSKFEGAWQEPILHQTICRQIWSAFHDDEREMAIKVARGYRKWREAQKRPPNLCNPQKILRERDAWPQYAALAGPDPSLRTFIAEGTKPFEAFRVAALIGGWSLPPILFDEVKASRGFWRNHPPSADLLGLSVFADKPIEQWVTLEENTKPFYAWAARIYDWFGKRLTPLRVPCLFPPRKDGSLGASSADSGGGDEPPKVAS
jgi:hypothetical protein